MSFHFICSNRDSILLDLDLILSRLNFRADRLALVHYGHRYATEISIVTCNLLVVDSSVINGPIQRFDSTLCQKLSLV